MDFRSKARAWIGLAGRIRHEDRGDKEETGGVNGGRGMTDRWNKTHCDKCKSEVGKGLGIYAAGGFYHKEPCWEEVKQEFIDNYEWDEHKTAYEREMICPYCGHEQMNSWETPGDDGTVECGRCEKEFDYTRNVEVTFTTTPRVMEGKA